MPVYPFSFEGEIVHHALGTMVYTVIFLPDDLAAQLPFDQHPRLRMSGEVNGAAVSGAWQPVRGRWYLMLSKSALRNARVSVGDTVEVRFRIKDQDAVDVPEPLQAALNLREAAAETWRRMTAGQRRGAVHQLTSAGTLATFNRRLAELVEMLEDGRWPGPPSRQEPRTRHAPLKSEGG